MRLQVFLNVRDVNRFEFFKIERIGDELTGRLFSVVAPCLRK